MTLPVTIFIYVKTRYHDFLPLYKERKVGDVYMKIRIRHLIDPRFINLFFLIPKIKLKYKI